MIKVEAVVIRERIETVIDAVEDETGHVGVTVIEAVGHGKQRGITHEYRGRVFATVESWSWTMMILSMAIAGVASETASPRTIGVWAGIFSSTTAVWWAWANWTGRLPQPGTSPREPDTVEVL